MKREEHNRKRNTGFTLMELLTVIGIVAIVAAILLPVLSSVRERGRRVVCESNLRQIALAVHEYVQDNGGIYPLALATKDNVEWDQAVFPYVKDNRVFRCSDEPADAPWVIAPSTLSPPFTDYTYDLERLNVFPPPYPTKNVHGIHESALAMPATIWLNVDASWSNDTGDHYFRTVPKTSCGRSFSGSTLHAGGGNYSFVDGHVRWLTPEAMGEVECANGPLPAPFKD